MNADSVFNWSLSENGTNDRTETNANWLVPVCTINV